MMNERDRDDGIRETGPTPGLEARRLAVDIIATRWTGDWLWMNVYSDCSDHL